MKSVKVIEAMKQIKDLLRKADDLRTKVKMHSADMDFETPTYENQKDKVRGWVQAHSDIMKEILDLRFRIQKTNIATSVPIELGGVVVNKTIAEWIHRRRELANLECNMWMQLTDRNLRDGQMTQSDGSKRDVKIRRYYSPDERDEKMNMFKSEPLMIDARLEVINATVDLLD